MGEYFYATLVSPAGAIEVIKVIDRDGNTFTVERGQDDTTAGTFQIGALVDMRVNVASIEDRIAEAPPGPQGFQGSQGIQGIQGPTGPEGVPGVAASLNLLGVSPTPDGLPASANDGDAWLISSSEIIYIWSDGAWFESLEFNAAVPGPRGPLGPQGIQGIQGIQGVQGPQGLAGVQASLNLLGVSPTTAGLPGSANNGEAWLTSDDDTIYIWFDGQWYASLEFTSGVSETSVANTYYVAKNGNNGNDGKALNRPKLTIEGGVAALAASGQPGVVHVYPGSYDTDGEIVVPENSAVIGVGGQYVTNVVSRIAHKNKNVFLVNSGSYVQGFAGRGQEVDDLDNPTGGFLVAFNPGATIVRSPYIRDMSQVSNFAPSAVTAPLDPQNANPLVGIGGGMLLADRAVLDQSSVFPYMVAFGATPRSPNGIGYCAKNGAGINGISAISIFSRVAFYALNGGQITLNNAGTQFGDISFRSKGHTLTIDADRLAQPIPTLANEAAAVANEKANIIDAMWNDIILQYPSRASDAQYESLARRDAGYLVDAIIFDFRAATDQSVRSFVKGMFDYNAQYVFDVALLPEFIFAFNRLQVHIGAVVVQSAPTLALTALLDIVRNTLSTPEPRRIKFASLIESQGHQFNNSGAGVNKNALPGNFRRPGNNQPVPFSILTEANPGQDNPLGRVSWNGSDEGNTQYFAGGTTISGTTGRFEGRAFTAGVRQIARRISNSRGVL